MRNHDWAKVTRGRSSHSSLAPPPPFVHFIGRSFPWRNKVKDSKKTITKYLRIPFRNIPLLGYANFVDAYHIIDGFLFRNGFERKAVRAPSGKWGRMSRCLKLCEPCIRIWKRKTKTKNSISRETMHCFSLIRVATVFLIFMGQWKGEVFVIRFICKKVG